MQLTTVMPHPQSPGDGLQRKGLLSLCTGLRGGIVGKSTRVPGFVGMLRRHTWEEASPFCLSKRAVSGLSGETEPAGCVRGEIYFKELAHLMMEARQVQNLMGRPADWRLRAELPFQPEGCLPRGSQSLFSSGLQVVG